MLLASAALPAAHSHDVILCDHGCKMKAQEPHPTDWTFKGWEDSPLVEYRMA